MQKRCIIVSAGDFHMKEIRREKNDFVIAVDGGALYCDRLGISPDLYLGDFDSLQEKQREKIERLEQEQPGRVRRLRPEKDDTDTQAALRYGLEKGYNDFWIYAGMGGRLEHTFANLQSLLFLKKQGAAGMLLDEGFLCLLLQNETMDFPAEKRGYLSMFSFGDRATGVDIEGMKYPLSDAVITNDFPIGIDNEFIGRPSRIRVRNGILLLFVRNM